VLLPPPEPPYFPRDCVRNPFKECRLSRADVDANRAGIVSIVREIQSKHDQLLVFDPINIFCDHRSCQYRKDSTLYYYDALHLTVRGSNHYAHNLLEWLHEQVLKKVTIQGNLKPNDK